MGLYGIRILLVDDDSDAREVLGVILRHQGAEVRSAASAAEALATFEAFAPDILVTDISMPGQDGYDLLRQVRELPAEAAQTPAIAVSGLPGRQLRGRCLEAGFQECLQKPVEIPALVETIAKFAAGRRVLA